MRVINITKAILVLIVIYFVHDKVSYGDIKKMYADSIFIYLIASALLLYISFFLQSVRFKKILIVHGCKISLIKLFNNCLISNSFSQFLPGSVAGDVYKLFSLAKYSNKKNILTCIVIDRGIGLLSFAIVSTITLMYFNFYTSNNIDFKVLFLLFFLVILPFIILLITNLMRDLVFHSLIILDVRYIDILKIFVYSLLSHIVFVIAIYIFGFGFNFNNVGIVVFPFAVFIGSLPISFAGWGVRELAFVSIINSYGISEINAVNFSISYGISYLLANIPGFLLYLWNKKNV
jgi:uncharacterized membrane protein YbhN (UPF0104 family)